MQDQLAKGRRALALRALISDVPGYVGFEDGRFTYRPPRKPCHGRSCGCSCDVCKPKTVKRAAVRFPWEEEAA